MTNNSIFGWRFSSQIPVFISAIILYFTLLEIYEKRKYAIAGTTLFLFSHALINFSHIGYNNTQALIFVTLTFFFLSASLKKPTLFNYFLLGVVSAFGAYSFPIASFMMPIALIVLLFYGRRKLLISFFLVGALTTISPLLIVNPNAIDIAYSRSITQIEGNPETH